MAPRPLATTPYWKPSLNSIWPTDFSSEIKALSIPNEKPAYLYADKNGLLVLDIDGDVKLQ